MKKIPSLFCRNYDTDHLVRDEIVVGSEWVARGEGVATRKYDGQCALVHNGKLFRRFDVKLGKARPAGWFSADAVDGRTGSQVGWSPVRRDDPQDCYFVEALDRAREIGPPANGTYELLGPKVLKNLERAPHHVLRAHSDADRLDDAPRTFLELAEYLDGRDIEGIVWHHPDGRMVKIKVKDFGLRRAPTHLPSPIPA